MDQKTFVRAVIRAYLQLPDTPPHARRADRALAAHLHQQHIPFENIRAAFILAAARRRFRPPPPLPPIRSLHYFLPVLDEVRLGDIDPGYIAYLQHRLAEHRQKAGLSHR